MVATGWPVLVSLSHKDFVGETLDAALDERLVGTLAATAVSAWHGAQVYRVHDVAPTRQVLDMVASIRGTRPPRGSCAGSPDRRRPPGTVACDLRRRAAAAPAAAAA